MSRVPEVLEERGYDFVSLCEELGIEPSIFADAEARLPLAVLDRMFALAEAKTGCDHLGLLAGSLPVDLGLPSFLLLHAPTIRVGFQNVIKILQLLHEAATLHLAEADGVATLSWSTSDVEFEAAHHVAEGTIAQIYGLLRRMRGESFRAQRILLPRKPPAELKAYRERFPKEELVFDAVQGAIEFDAKLLDLPPQNADPQLYAFLKKLAEQKIQTNPEDLVLKIRRSLPMLVIHERVTLPKLARSLGVNAKSLSRWLTAKGVTASSLIKEAQDNCARQLLENTSLPMVEIAATLHYSDAAAFTRAFRRRFGMPPSAWRERIHSLSS